MSAKAERLHLRLDPVLLTRLGVDSSVRGVGLGRALVVDALRRIAGAADVIGVRAVLIHCESASARDFYLRLAAFEPSPTDPMHLLLLMKDLRHALSPEFALTAFGSGAVAPGEPGR